MTRQLTGDNIFIASFRLCDLVIRKNKYWQLKNFSTSSSTIYIAHIFAL